MYRETAFVCKVIAISVKSVNEVGLFFAKFEVPHRQQFASERTPLSLFAPAPSAISWVPLTRNLSPADPSPAPSKALGTRNGSPFSGSLKTSVPERASYGTEYVFGVKKGFLGYATHFQRHSVLKKASWCTRRVFKYTRCKKQASITLIGTGLIFFVPLELQALLITHK